MSVQIFFVHTHGTHYLDLLLCQRRYQKLRRQLPNKERWFVKITIHPLVGKNAITLVVWLAAISRMSSNSPLLHITSIWFCRVVPQSTNVEIIAFNFPEEKAGDNFERIFFHFWKGRAKICAERGSFISSQCTPPNWSTNISKQLTK